MKTCKKCLSQFQCTIVIEGKRRNLANRKFCFKCSPFGLHNTRDITNINEPDGFHQCPKCLKVLINTEFFRSHSWCRKCISNRTLQNQRDFKQKCIDYKGGCCNICSYKKCNTALEFHHLDKNKKDFNISQFKCVSAKNSFHKVELELDKCILVCSNCHREIHSGLIDLSEFGAIV